MNKKQLTGINIEISSEVITEIISCLLGEIDEICQKENIEFFVYGDILRQAVHYQKMLPFDGRCSFEVGLLRSEYQKFISVIDKHAEQRNLIISNHPDLDFNNKYQASIIRIGKSFALAFDEITIKDEFYIRICPFDKVPESVDTYSGFSRVMKRANKKLQRITGCRIFLEGYTTDVGKTGKKFRQFLWQNICGRGRNQKRAYENIQKKAQRYQHTNSQTYQRVVEGKTAKITEAQLHPLRRIPFGDITIPIPKDFSPWTEIYKDEQKEQIQKIQKIDLMLLKEFDRVCRKIGVGYFLCGGSMLGYVRHGGFIPWDDDIDCGMMRDDYQRFLAEAGKYLDTERFFLQTRQSDPTIPYLFSKIRMNHTLYMTEYNKNRKFHKGICLDIFPFDYIPEDKKKQKEFMIEVKRHARRHHFIANRQKGDPPADDIPKTTLDKWYRFLGSVHRKLFRLIPLSITQNQYDRFVTQYNVSAKKNSLTMVGSFVPTYTWAKVETLKPYKTIDFEGVQAMVPNKPEVFLEMQYGDYMIPPPSHLQIGHDLVAWSVDYDKIVGDDLIQ